MEPLDPKEGPFSPCESPLEDIFLEEFCRVADDQIRIWRQYDCQTRAGSFRLDFALGHVSRGPQLGIECDGRDFHSTVRDAKRDAAIVAAGIVDKIYRLRGRDLARPVYDTFHLLSTLEAWLFSERGRINLRTLTGSEHLYRDYVGPNDRGFPFSAMRSFEGPPTQEDDYDDYDDSPFKRPVHIFWTQKNA